MLEAIVFFRCKITDNITDRKNIGSKFFRPMCALNKKMCKTFLGGKI